MNPGALTLRALSAALGVALLVVAAPAVASATLALEQVLASSREHFPRIQAAVQERLAREGRVTAALGAFDLALEQDNLAWASGYYEGRSVDTRLTKRLPLANAKVFGGYRLGTDDFPVYQQELVTNDGGEFNFGIVLSLWRDRAIDAERFAVNSARLGVREAELDLVLAQLATQRLAARAYWSWVAAGKNLAIYRELLALAEQRMSGFERRAREGDIAEIFVTENRQNLLRRRALVVEAERDFALAAIELSLYLRDDAGEPLRPRADALPTDFPDSGTVVPDPDALVADTLARRPELARLDNARMLESQRLALAENALLPRVDLGLKGAQDIGGGSRTRRGFDTLVDLTLSIPLERRRGEGLIAESRARLRQLEFERTLTEQRLGNEIRKLGTALNAAREFVAVTADEAVQATRMVTAEHQRFAAGASDFFLVNLREERSADARLRNLDAHLRYHHGLTDLQAVTIDRESLGL